MTTRQALPISAWGADAARIAAREDEAANAAQAIRPTITVTLPPASSLSGKSSAIARLLGRGR